MEKYDCPNECSATIDTERLKIEGIEFYTSEETGCVGGQYHVFTSVKCDDGHQFSETLKFFPASCPCVSLTDDEIADNERRKQYDITEQSTTFITKPSGMGSTGHGWFVKFECPRCGNTVRNTYTMHAFLARY
jgi:hypothetical protein